MKKVPLEKNIGPKADVPPSQSEEDTLIEGWIACDRGTGKHRNPYVKDTEAYEWWRRGWEKRYYNEPREEF